MAWIQSQLSVRGFLDRSVQHRGFTCLMTWLSSGLKSSSREYGMYPYSMMLTVMNPETQREHSDSSTYKRQGSHTRTKPGLHPRQGTQRTYCDFLERCYFITVMRE